MMTSEEKASAWDSLTKELDVLVPDWNDPSHGVRTPVEAAKVALRQLASAAEWGEYSTLVHHLRNELIATRSLAAHPDLPESMKPALTAHLQRMARLA